MISTLITNNDWIEYLGIYGKKSSLRTLGGCHIRGRGTKQEDLSSFQSLKWKLN